MKTVLFSEFQMGAWHDGGLFMGMHWVWWLIAIITFCSLAWALVRVSTDRAKTRRRVDAQEIAEEALRRRFASGEIDEEEFAHRLKILRETAHGV
jgi:putative membrane protein